MFRKYHYLNTELHTAATQYIALWGDELVAHTGILQFPMRKGWKRVHRLVVLPDYQGVGIGTAFINEIAKITAKRGYELNLTTTTPALMYALKRSDNWKLIRFGRVKGSVGTTMAKHYGAYGHLAKTTSKQRITYSFNYIDKDGYKNSE